jgi:hypothetical protein
MRDCTLCATAAQLSAPLGALVSLELDKDCTAL